jgi:hypothetical protein
MANGLGAGGSNPRLYQIGVPRWIQLAPSFGKLLRYELARLSHFKPIFGLRARKFLLLSTSAPRKSAKTGQVKTLPLF